MLGIENSQFSFNIVKRHLVEKGRVGNKICIDKVFKNLIYAGNSNTNFRLKDYHPKP